MNAIYELLLCPQHGILRPDNWPLVMGAFAGLKIQAASWAGKIWRKS
jgi:hypothetical protein